MKKYSFLILLLTLLTLSFVSCDDYETYADQKNAEKATIANYISTRNIHVIDENEFKARIASGASVLTDTAKNEYVLFSNTGIYMQVINIGVGDMIQSGETTTVLCRFTEYNLKGDSLQLGNMTAGYAHLHYIVDKMNVTKRSGSFYGSFDTTSSIMYSKYGSASVPAGWLVPLSYVKIGRYQDAESRLAHVKIIVPHDQGQTYATSSVYACAYDIYYERGM